MAKVKKLAFDRIALEAAVREHPGDTTAQAALRDWLHEFEYSWIGAGRVVMKIVREELSRRQRKRVETYLAEKSGASDYTVSIIRRRAGVARDVEIVLFVIEGDQPATIIADAGYWANSVGTPVDIERDRTISPVGLRWIDGAVSIQVGANYVERGCPNRPSVIIV